MSKYYLTMEMGGTNLRYAIVDEEFRLIDFLKVPTRELAKAENKVDFIYGILEPIIIALGKENIICISFALASLMDRDRTIIYSSPMVSGFNNIPLKAELEKRLSLPVFMEKDVNSLLLYEMRKQRFSAEGITVGVFIGTGLGNAMCINGKIYKGNSGTACELGHIPVPYLEKECGCGKKGCIETLACGNILAKLAVDKYKCDVRDIFTLHRKESDVLDIVNNSAIACATEFTILDPELVIIGGGVTQMNDFPYEYFINKIKENLRFPNPRNSIEFLRASEDAQAGVIGAAINAYQLMV